MSWIPACAGTVSQLSERDAKFTTWTRPMGVAAPGFGAKAAPGEARAAAGVAKSEKPPFGGVEAGLAEDSTHVPEEIETGLNAAAAVRRSVAYCRGDDENTTMPAA